MTYLITGSPTQPVYSMEKIGVEEMLDMIKDEQVLGCDTETQGLSHVDNRMLMLQISTLTDNFIIDAQTVDISPLSEIFRDYDITKIFHNAAFDVRFLKASGIEVERVWDTMLIEQAIYLGTDTSCSLKEVLTRYKGITADKEVRSTFIDHSGDFTREQLEYAAEDTEHLIHIMAKQFEEVERLELEEVVTLENDAVLAFADCTFNGLWLDKSKWLKIAKNSEREVELIRLEMVEMLKDTFLPNEINCDMFGEPEINFNSPKQILELFQTIVPELESVGRPVLAPYRKDHKIIDKYISFKEAAKKANAYGIKFVNKYVHSDGKIHPNFRQMVSTGRVSSSNPNCQQVPQEGGFRECFMPPKENWVIVAADYSSQELCVAAYGAQEKVWLEVLRSGGDLHSVSAEKVYGEDFTKLEIKSKPWANMRNATKAITFLLTYGGGAYTLAKRLEIEEDEAQELMYMYFDAFPKLKKFLDRLGEYGTNNGIIRSFKPFRRRRVFDKWDGDMTSNAEMSRIDRQSRNYAIQSTSADMTKQAMVYIREAVKKSKGRAAMLMPIHDELVTTAHRDYAEEWASILKKEMERAANLILEPGLLKSDPQISEAWVK